MYDPVADMVRGTDSFRRWANTPATPGKPVTREREAIFFTRSFVGSDFWELGGDYWHKCRCVYASLRHVYFIRDDGEVCHYDSKSFRSAVRNKRLKK